MSVIQEYLASIEDGALVAAVKECLGWDKTGRLNGSGVQALATDLGAAVGLDGTWPLDEMPKLLYREAAIRFVAAH